MKKTYGEKKGARTKPPIEEIDLEQKTLELEVRSEYGGMGSEASQESKADSFKTLPSYLGEYEANSEIRKLPTLKMPSPKTLNISSLSMLLSAPIKCTLPLPNLLRARPKMWEGVVRYLKTIGVDIPMGEINQLKGQEKQTKVVPPVPLNKVGDYCEGEDSNIIIPVSYQGVKTFAILDSRVGVAITTKGIWEAWGRPALRKTRMKFQLADGHIERPIRLLEGVIVTSCGVEYEHTFAMVDFGTSPNYEIILGCSFMRQLKMIQDWGFNYIYLRQNEAITLINLLDHSYKDVARNPIEDYESTTLITISSQHS